MHLPASSVLFTLIHTAHVPHCETCLDYCFCYHLCHHQSIIAFATHVINIMINMDIMKPSL